MTLIAAVIGLWWRRDRLALPAAFALGGFLPASNLLLPIASLYAQNFLYMPLIGACLVAGELPHRRMPAAAADPDVKIPPRLWVAGALIGVLGMAAPVAASIWRDHESLFRAWTRQFPNHALAYRHLGLALLEGGRPQDTIPSLRRSVALDDRSVETRANLASPSCGREATARGWRRRCRTAAPRSSRVPTSSTRGSTPATSSCCSAVRRRPRPRRARRSSSHPTCSPPG